MREMKFFIWLALFSLASAAFLPFSACPQDSTVYLQEYQYNISVLRVIPPVNSTVQVSLNEEFTVSFEVRNHRTFVNLPGSKTFTNISAELMYECPGQLGQYCPFPKEWIVRQTDPSIGDLDPGSQISMNYTVKIPIKYSTSLYARLSFNEAIDYLKTRKLDPRYEGLYRDCDRVAIVSPVLRVVVLPEVETIYNPINVFVIVLPLIAYFSAKQARRKGIIKF